MPEPGMRDAYKPETVIAIAFMTLCAGQHGLCEVLKDSKLF